jgi:secondary thiamine-phosphate synthase enzyme
MCELRRQSNRSYVLCSNIADFSTGDGIPAQCSRTRGRKMIAQDTLEYRTHGRGMTDVTADVARVVATSHVMTGICTIFLRHTSASLILCENADPDVRRDLETIIARLAPDGDPEYRHDTEGSDDMAAHARVMLTSNSLSIPVGDGHLLLGTWQGIYLWEHRLGPQIRRIVVTVMGEQ